MSNTNQTQQSQQAELQKRLWKIANDLRGNMDANEFRNYILSLIFYRFLSDKIEDYVNNNLLEAESVNFIEAYELEDYREGIKEEALNDLGFFIEPKYLFSTLVKEINQGNFDIEDLQNAVIAVENSTIGQRSEDDFRGLFEDLDLSSSRLGSTPAERSKMIAAVILNLHDLEIKHDEIEIDILGDAYEYLIGQFAANAGKKAGEFYTPQQVSKILAKAVTLGRMNLLMHGVNYTNFNVQQGDTLENDHFGDQKFSAVVANPPYSANWNPDGKLDDERFRAYGKTAPKSKADFAFVEHMLYHLAEDGTMAVVLPHGVLFRGAGEGTIRRYMIENMNFLDAVIGLPANLFYGTSIPTTVLVFKKNRSTKDIFFIDASNDFDKGKNQNTLTDAHVDKIIETYAKRENVDKYAHVATFDEIVENDFNLNIPRYVDTFKEEEPIDLAQVEAELKAVDIEIAKAQAEFDAMVAELVETKND
ncbi:N-6 DNA methylase [Leuconostoc pseudomesenteroides]|uniref:N-6 DNA methylase n=1 Tax=Leuconostoc pseudomesenteroides TaxID=33968 RepID=UPI0028967AFF|nr:N-6 DNA methylase [Leuconostoc pseudomesenteroides]